MNQYTVTAATLFIIANTSFASSFEVSLSAGPNWANTNNTTTLVVSQIETDSLHVNNVSNSALFKLGIGYHAFPETRGENHWLNDFLLELNLYRTTDADIKGRLWQYQFPQFDNYSFAASFNSTRLMLDVKPTLYSQQRFRIYPIAGIGVSLNNTSYSEQVASPDVPPGSAQVLGSHTNAQFAYDLGAGIKMQITPQISVSLEYLYANLGDMTPSGRSKTNARLIAPPTFKVNNQSALIGVSWVI